MTDQHGDVAETPQMHSVSHEQGADSAPVGDVAEETATPPNEEHFVPAWLAALVLVLLLAVVGVGGYAIRGFVAGDRRVESVEQAEIDKWRKEVKAEPLDLDARLQLGYAYQLAGRYDNALKEYGFIIERDPKNTAALYNRGVSYLELDLQDKAEEAFWDVLEVRNDHALAAKQLGELYAERGQYKSLLKAVRPVVEAHPQMADLQYLTGLAYERTGHPDWALARYRLALEYSPDMPEAREGVVRLGGEQ